MGNLSASKKRIPWGVTLVLPVIISALYLWYSSYNLQIIQHSETSLTESGTERETFPTTLTMAQSDQTTSTIADDGASTQITTSGGVTIERNPSQSKLNQLGVVSWPKWEGSPSKIPWTFDTKETMYLLEGKVKVSCDGYDGSFEIGAGDLVVFPQGMKITWEVIESVKKHYHLEK